MPKKFNPNYSTQPDVNAAIYWTGPVTRRELQDVLDEITPVIKELVGNVHGSVGTPDAPPQQGLIMMIAKLDMTLGFLMDRLAIPVTEFQTYIDAKTVEYKALQEAAKQQAEVTEIAPKVTLD